MAKPPPLRPGPAARTKGAEAIAYRAAMVVAMLVELLVRRPPAPKLEQHARNAFIQSALIDLRALIGFLLIDANDVVPKPGGGYKAIGRQPADLHPAWYLPAGHTWVPRTARRRRALYSFYGPVGTHLAHVAVKTRTHPGDWPLVEAALVVGQDLEAFLDELEAVAPKEAQRFLDVTPSLRDTVQALALGGYGPYPADRAEPAVRRARRLLRTQLRWPTR